ncbi:MAG: tyrosine-type recombinase/integrase [Labrys sp. (in: a-proteobacteria)]
MAKPQLRNGTYRLNEAVPTDLRPLVKGKTVPIQFDGKTYTPKAGTHVTQSLFTKDKREAYRRFNQAYEGLLKVWDSYRNDKPVDLSHIQIMALAGQAYASIDNIEITDDTADPDIWDMGEAFLNAAIERKEVDAFEKEAENVVRSLGLNSSEASMRKLSIEVAKAYHKHNRLMRKRAEGDYSPDPNLSSFPKLEDIKASTLTISDMFEAWVSYSNSFTNNSPNTVRRYRNAFNKFIGYTKNELAANIKPKTIQDYLSYLLSINSRKTASTEFKAIQTVFRWASEPGRHLQSDPTDKIKGPRLDPSDPTERAYTDEEARTILRASLVYQKKPNEAVYTANAKRWLPWLAAFTGARIGELVRLKKSNFSKREDGWYVFIKNNKPRGVDRYVPIHEQLIEIGLIDFVSSSKTDYLFYDASVPTQSRERNAVEQVRSIVRDAGIKTTTQPNHAWRHRFATIARGTIDTRKVENTLGHKQKGIAGGYGGGWDIYHADIMTIPYIKIE